ncbi:MAG: hypothetical protein AB7D36_10285 [Oscillospiraceae bacterium]
MLPSMKYSGSTRTSGFSEFRGYKHLPSAQDGEIWDMGNMASDGYPALKPRRPRTVEKNLNKPNGIFPKVAVDGTNFIYNGTVKGTVTDTPKTFCAMYNRIIILPDKAYYNTLTDTFGSLESAYSGGVSFRDGTLYGESAAANTIYASGVTWSDYFKVGDAVTISGCTAHTDNNKTPIIREIDGDELHFYENVFDTGSESGVTIARTVPDLDFICENENRLWGCRGSTIYASKLGDPFNWNVFDGLSTDSYSAPVGSAGDFTGCVSYLGYPIFFKPDYIYKVYGDKPTNFQVMSSASLGVAAGSAKSLAVAGETLFYLSRAGIVAYTGGIPAQISRDLGAEFQDAVAGSDGLRYYVSMRSGSAQHLFVYDTALGLWHREDDLDVLNFAWDGGLYALAADGRVLRFRSDGGEVISSFVEFADFYAGSIGKKNVQKLFVRAELEAGAVLRMYIRYRGGESWRLLKTVNATEKRAFYIPVMPNRCDYYRLRFEGTGDYTIHSIANELKIGSAK